MQRRALLASPSAQRNLVLLMLLTAAAACWALILAQAGADRGMAMASPTMGLPAPAFLAIWTIMMVAMMFPTAAPMILTFHRIQSGKRARGEAFVSTWLFVAGYTLMWAAAGIAAYLGAVAAEAVAARTGLSAAMAARIGGALVIAAGLYQLTPLKNVCLSKCRSPIGFILTSWRGGSLGALRMGLLHGGSCFGCCWLLMVDAVPARHHEPRGDGADHADHLRREIAGLGTDDGVRHRGGTGDLRPCGRGGAAGAADLCRTRSGNGHAGNGEAGWPSRDAGPGRMPMGISGPHRRGDS